MPAAPLLELVRERYPGRRLSAVFREHGLRRQSVSEIETGAVEWLSYDVADRVIVRVLGDAGLWQRVPWLAEIAEAELE